MEWFYAKDGSPSGPITEDDFRARVVAGEIKPDTHVWNASMPDWQRAQHVPGVFDAAPHVVSPVEPVIAARPEVRPVLSLLGSTATQVVLGLLIGSAVMHAIAVLSGLAEIGLLATIQEGGELDPQTANSNDSRQQAIAIVQLVLYLVTAGFFATWAYRAHQNLSLLAVPALKYTPGWAAGGFFIPFVNLVRPFQVIREVWKASDPALTGALWTTSTANLVTGWWVSFLLMNALGQISSRLVGSTPTLDDLMAAGTASLLSDLVGVVAALLAFLMIRGISLRQRAKAAAAPAV